LPELPEVETIRRALEKTTVGCRIAHIIILRDDYVQTNQKNPSCLRDAIIKSLERRGKIIAIHLSGGWILLHHLGMSGRILRVPGDAPMTPHTHIRILLDDGRQELRQWDPRRFGYVAILREEELNDYSPWMSLGVDPFDLDLSMFLTLLEQRKQPIKSFLLDQRRIAGLGNIYADESLFRSGIHPLRAAGSLNREETELLLRCIQQVLDESIAAGGSSTNDYQKLDGSLGEFQHRHRVYRKTGEPCQVCGNRIKKIVVGGRSTHFCPQCQPLNAKRMKLMEKEERKPRTSQKKK